MPAPTQENPALAESLGEAYAPPPAGTTSPHGAPGALPGAAPGAAAASGAAAAATGARLFPASKNANNLETPRMADDLTEEEEMVRRPGWLAGWLVDGWGGWGLAGTPHLAPLQTITPNHYGPVSNPTPNTHPTHPTPTPHSAWS